NQFAFTEFLLDYREFLRWLSHRNSQTHASSWVSYCCALQSRSRWTSGGHVLYQVFDHHSSYCARYCGADVEPF
ncbi:MAG: hypothetical protein J3Q66DRAFT_290773, partial [Benniella sp.]